VDRNLIFNWRKRKNLYLLSLVALSVVLLLQPISVKQELADFLFGFTFGPFFSIGKHLAELKDVAETNRLLKEKLARLNLENYRLKEEGLENQRLRNLLEFKSNINFEPIPAEVIGIDPGRLTDFIWINAGNDRQVQRNAAVINLKGLVGKVIEVYPKSSLVQLLLNSDCKVSALDQRSRVFGIVKKENGMFLKMDNVPNSEEVKTGDKIITSGLGGIFPLGIEIGSVVKSETDTTQIFRQIRVKPTVDFSTLEELFVIPHFEELNKN
jgi:rod shape-determining protein MreC